MTYLLPNQALVNVDPQFIDASRSGHKVAYLTSAQELAVASIRSYVRPKGATPVSVPLVPAYAECTSRQSGARPADRGGMCGPPQQASPNLTVGTPDANGAAANSSGFVRLTAVVGVPGLPNDSDIAIDVSLSDVRCQAGVATCGPANDEPGDDYTGELRLEAGNRITDLSSPDEFGDPDPLGATVQDASFPSTVPCAATPETDRGGDCSISTSANALLPGSVLDGKRAIWALAGIRVLDGGAAGMPTPPATTHFSRRRDCSYHRSDVRSRLASAAVLLLLLIPATPAGAAFPGANGQVAVTSDQECDLEILRFGGSTRSPTSFSTLLWTVEIRRGRPTAPGSRPRESSPAASITGASTAVAAAGHHDRPRTGMVSRRIAARVRGR